MTAISEALGSLRAEREQLVRRLERVDRAVKSLEELEDTAVATTVTRREEQQRVAVRGDGGTPAAISRVFGAHPGRAYSIPEMHLALRDSGWTSDANNVRNVVSVNMRRMSDRGQLERLPDGRFRVPYATLDSEGHRSLEDATADAVEDEEDWVDRRDEEAEELIRAGH